MIIGTPDSFSPDEAFAADLDAGDPLRVYRERFHIPPRPDGQPSVYLAGNSLGLQPRTVGPLIAHELEDWANLGVDAHFHGRTPWYSYHEVFRDIGARLVGGRSGEVVMMNSLTVNLHLMLASFYKPTESRYKVLIEYPCFPSDTYAIKSHLACRGQDPGAALLEIRPRDGECLIRTVDVESLLERHGESVALIMLAGVNFFTGQFLDIKRITAAGHRAGCIVGWDLAHAVGNVPLQLHDWDVDFAVWCSYKYLNAGPGAVAGCFVHEKHGNNPDLSRLAGWWGNDPARRFMMHLLPEFSPRPGADGWQVSNPPILAMVPLRASLDIFDEIGMASLREKSQRQTAYLLQLLDALPGSPFEIVTPRSAEERGCQISLVALRPPKACAKGLSEAGIVCDFREPNVIRVAPTPLYNSYHDIWILAQALGTLSQLDP